MNQNLRIPILSTVKLRICLRCLINTDLMAYNERGLGAAGDDHVAKVAVVRFYVALTSSYGKSLSNPPYQSLLIGLEIDEATHLLKKLPKRN